MNKHEELIVRRSLVMLTQAKTIVERNEITPGLQARLAGQIAIMSSNMAGLIDNNTVQEVEDE